MKTVVCEKCGKKIIISDGDFIIGKKYLCYECRGGHPLRKYDVKKNRKLDEFIT